MCAKVLQGYTIFFHIEILTQKYCTYRYISNYCVHDYSQGVLDGQDIAQMVHPFKKAKNHSRRLFEMCLKTKFVSSCKSERVGTQ